MTTAKHTDIPVRGADDYTMAQHNKLREHARKCEVPMEDITSILLYPARNRIECQLRNGARRVLSL